MIFFERAEVESASGSCRLEVAGFDACLPDRPANIDAEQVRGVGHWRGADEEPQGEGERSQIATMVHAVHGSSFWPARHLTIILRATFCSIVAPTPAGDLSLRADYAWQDKIQFNVIKDVNYRGACGSDHDRAVA